MPPHGGGIFGKHGPSIGKVLTGGIHDTNKVLGGIAKVTHSAGNVAQEVGDAGNKIEHGINGIQKVSSKLGGLTGGGGGGAAGLAEEGALVA